MSPSEIISLCAGGLMTVVTGVVLFVLKGYMADMKAYRQERDRLEAAQKEKEQAKDDLILGIARVMLLETYQKCESKGYYSVEDREVYEKLFEAYILNGGDGVIDDLVPKIRALPTSLPKQY